MDYLPEGLGWMPLSARATPSGRIEVQVAHPDAGLVVFIENENKKVYYNRSIRQHEVEEKLPHVPRVQLVAQSTRRKFMAYFSCSPKVTERINPKTREKETITEGYDHSVFVLSSDYQATTFK